MNRITCEICRDLIPLVQDGVASKDSVEAVHEHIEQCHECAELFHKHLPNGDMDDAKIIVRFKHYTNSVLTVLLFIFIVFGVSLTDGMNVMMNTVIMPVTGTLSCIVFGRSALWRTPAVIAVFTVLYHFTSLLQGREGYGDIGSIVMFIILYSLFALCGIVIAALLHYAFRKEHLLKIEYYESSLLL